MSQSISAEIEDNYVLVYGAELHYLQGGEGPVVLLLHGLVETAEQWRAVMEQLAPQFCAIALDQIGFGYSSKPFLNYRIQTLVDFLQGFCQTLGIRQAALVGAGMGAWVALAFALQHPKQVSHLALVNPLINAAALKHSALMGLQPLATREQTQTLLRSLFDNSDDWANEQVINWQFTQQMLLNDGYTKQQLMQSIRRGEDAVEPDLTQLNLPTVLIYGQRDRFSSSVQRDRLCQQLPQAQLQILGRCGHLPHIEQPNDLSTVLRQFLQP